MNRFTKIIFITLFSLFMVSCSSAQKSPQSKEQNSIGQADNKIQVQQKEQQPKKIEISEKENKENVNYNEAGKVMILMFHNFSDKEKDEWTRSFENYKKDLQILYDKGYRPVNLRDYIEGNIDIPAGYTPVVFTFDDGTSGQFNLIEQDGKLVASPKSAVGIMEEFCRAHPDFPLKGTFFINHTGFFHGKGTSQQRLKYLTEKGFEIGNHTIDHVNLRKVSTAQEVQKQIGGHVKKTSELLPGYIEDELALPLGITSKKFPKYIEKGEYEGTKYQNRVILLVGANPALSPIDKKIDLLKLPRVRGRGNKPVELDMYYWLNYFDKNPSERFISDGDKDNFTIPIKYQDKISNRINKNIVLLK